MVLPPRLRRIPSQHLRGHIQHIGPRHRSLPAAAEARSSPTRRRIHPSSKTTSPWSTKFRGRRIKCGSLTSFPNLPHAHPFWKTLQLGASRRRVQMGTSFRKPSEEGLVMFYPKLQEGFLRNWGRRDNEKGNHLHCRRHRCPDWAHCHRVHPRGCWGRWGRSGRNCNGLRRMCIHTPINLILRLNSSLFSFTKSQKRASVLLADMSQSLLNAWTTPAPSPVTGASVSTNPFVASISPTQTEDRIPERSAAKTSLLDDDGDLQGHGGGLKLGVVMKPDTMSLSASAQNKSDDDDDDWNW